MRAIPSASLPRSVQDAALLLAKLIAATRKANKVSQRATCEAVGIGRSTLIAIESGSPRVQFAHWLSVLDHLGLVGHLANGPAAANMALVADSIKRPAGRRKRA